jgi:AraC-like DNA-binding protein
LRRVSAGGEGQGGAQVRAESPGKSLDACHAGLLLFRGRRAPEDLLLASADRVPRLQDGYTAGSIELAVVDIGPLCVDTSTALFHLSPGHLLVVERGVKYGEMLPAEGEESHAYWCHLIRTHAVLRLLRHTRDSAIEEREWDLPGRTDVESIGSALAGELAGRDRDYAVAASGLLDYLTSILIRRALRGAVVSRPPREVAGLCPDPRQSALLHAAVAYCNLNFRKGVTQVEVARAVGCSARYLSRLASAFLGRSLAEQVREARLAEARYLLENTELPIRAIAAAVGYPDPAHFTRAFTREVGTSPDRFRRRLQRVLR